ncbi:MAG: tetratricopeptide repeat protein [Planctomycetota bacterium]
MTAYFVSLCFAHISDAQEQPAVELSPMVTQLLEDDLLTDEQRREAMIFHGQWEQLEEPTPHESLLLFALQQKAIPAKGRGAFEPFVDCVFTGPIDLTPEVDLLLAKIALQDGSTGLVTFSLGKQLQEHGRPLSRLLLAHAFEDEGAYQKAKEQLHPIREQAQQGADALITAEDLTAAAEAMLMLARLEGRPAADFHLANTLLSKARDEVDPLYWPAYVAEAELLMAKGNPREAMEAVSQALSLNPKSSEAWYLFGSMRCRFFDFEAANRAVKELHAINEEHPLADVLAIEIALRQKDVARAQEVIGPALERYPSHRKLLAMNAAVQAMTYDVGAMDGAVARFAELAPGNPLAEFMIGRSMSDARQYKIAEGHLQTVIEMMPGWSEPQLTLGEVYVQWGKLEKAAEQLQTASSLDPFHKGINNQLMLVQEMLGYAVIKSDQFLVRYLPGVDEVLARDVALHMGEMVDQFIERFQHDPPAITQVDLMPDDQHFAVRITGMPSIWTIAACTGDVIAMTPPRPGPKRAYGPYNWLNVMGHEYAHVVNLSQTDNRVPHWFTEGCAVNMETTGRLWSQYELLADCYNTGRLFEYDEINWGFIRPTEPYHRPLAYAQSAWIKEYIETVFGWDKAIAMLNLYQQGVGEHETIKQVFGIEVEEFMAGFMAWAGDQVEAWGMTTHGTKPEDVVLAALLSNEGIANADIETLTKASQDHPDRPELLKYLTEKVLLIENKELAFEIIKQYQEKRPVDPWADRQLARLALEAGDSETAIAALKNLDKIEGNTPEYAVELARVYRSRKDYDNALHYAERALLREPYNAIYRETAATIAIQQKDLERAAFHVESLAILEPDRIIHQKRLAAIYTKLGDAEKADTVHERIKLLDLPDNN